MNDKRKEPRHRVPEKTFAIDWSSPQRLGEVIDISRSGVSFRCMEGHNGFQRTVEIGVFSSTDNFFLKRVLFETVADVQLEGHPSSTIIMRRHSGRLLNLTEMQQAELDNFIKHHALGPV